MSIKSKASTQIRKSSCAKFQHKMTLWKSMTSTFSTTISHTRDPLMLIRLRDTILSSLRLIVPGGIVPWSKVFQWQLNSSWAFCFQLLKYFIVVRTLNMRSALSRFPSGHCSIVIYRCKCVAQISKIY
jgi:hypothetical protein